VRSVVLDGGTLVDVPILERLGSNGQRALDLLARRCAADRGCSQAFPRWRADLPGLLARLGARPVHRTVAGQRVTLDGTGVAGLIQLLTQSSADAAQIPFVVAEAVRGRYEPLARMATRPSSSTQPRTAVMPYSIMCNEPWAVRDPARAAADAKGTYLAAAVKEWAAEQRAVCRAFPKRAERAADWARPHGSTPLLAVLGGADPQDPLANVGGIRKTMPNSAVAVVPGEGHTVGHLDCMPDLVARFLDRGSVHGLDMSCVKRISLPSFRLR
jgi:hypothetical protein